MDTGNFDKFKSRFNRIISRTLAENLLVLHKIIFETTPKKNVRQNLQHFQGFSPSTYEDKMKFLNDEMDIDEIREACELICVTFDESESQENLSKEILKKLTSEKIQSSENQQHSDVTSCSNKSSLSVEVELCEKLERVDEEIMNMEIKMCDLEEQLENLQKTDYEESEKNKLERELRVLGAKHNVAFGKKRTMEAKLKQSCIEQTSDKKSIYSSVKVKKEFIQDWVNRSSEVNSVQDENIQKEKDCVITEIHSLKNTVSSMLVRQGEGVNLPNFDGTSHLAWNNFVRKYQLSTIKCQLSKDENLLRLDKHLKGEAKSKVELLLLSSVDPQKIINILNTEYGGNEKILQELVSKACEVKLVDSLARLKDFNCTVQNVACAIDGIDGDLYDVQKMLAIFLKKLPEHIVLQWANHLMAKKIDGKRAAFGEFSKWVLEMSSAVSDVTFFSTVNNLVKENLPSTSKNDERKTHTNQNKNQDRLSEDKMCKLCKAEAHQIEKCTAFIKLNVNKRWEYIKKIHLCYSCLKNHRGQCNKRQQCKNCDKFHHELLHKSTPTNTENVTACIKENESTVLLKIIPVKIRGPHGVINICAFLDEGSTITLIDKSIAEPLGLSGKSSSLCFKWTNGIYRHEPESQNVTAAIAPENGTVFFNVDNVRTVTDLELPRQNINFEKILKDYPEINNFNITSSWYSKKPMILIGQRHASLITSRETIEIESSGLLISKTKLGWAIHGPTLLTEPSESTDFVCCQTVEHEIDALVKQHFQLDSFGVCLSKEDRTKSEEERRAISIAENSIKKVGKHYEIALPWRDDEPELPNSRPLAYQRLQCLERKFKKNPKLFDSYQEQIQKLIDKEYARKISFEYLKNKKKVWFLPHFAVVNPKKPEKPPRVVFDAAAKVNKKSLNDYLLCGPDWLSSIIGVLIRFRQFSIAFSGDIQEMFNRVKIVDEDASAQCFLWRDGKKINVYLMKSMLFGINSSPFLAQFVKNYNAKVHRNEYPEAFQAITRDHYVDDFLGSTETEEEAEKLVNDVIFVHCQGGFNIRSFISNNSNIFKNTPSNLLSDKMLTDVNKSDVQQRILGLLWDAKSDVFKFKIDFHRVDRKVMSGEKTPTKRDVLKATMTVYDPLGFVSPVTIQSRLLMQKIWLTGLGWDDELESSLLELWRRWLQEVQNLMKIEISRCYSKEKKPIKIELHVFNDASQKAYCSVAYLRYIFGDNTFKSSLVFSKSRVTPSKSNKTMTIPKMELLAAVLGVRISKIIQKEVTITIDEIFYWTDSTIVMSWINSKGPLKSFEASRVGEILENSKANQWYWLSTTVNIADQGTRDHHTTLCSESEWFHGPKFLYDQQKEWCKSTGEFNPSKEIVAITSIVEEDNSDDKLIDETEYSNLNKLLRVSSWVNRFISNSQKGKDDRFLDASINPAEVEQAISKWAKAVQKIHFKDDLLKIKNKSRGPTRLSKYNLRIDDNGILRISGRLERAKDLLIETKQPIILDGRHHFTKLLIMDLHQRSFHFGIQVVINKFKMKYWMPQMNSKINQIIHSCYWCKLKRSMPLQPLMGQLPVDRFYFYEKPFYSTGIDYFGPFYVKSGRRVETRYGVLFICLTTRAIHVEISHSLNTDSCIMAVRRMMSRRGQITIMWSDNGTNLRGSSRELLEALEELYPDKIREQLLKYGIDWKFIPPAAPNFGGSWEKAIGCFKKSLEAVLSVNRNPTDEVLSTVFCEAETLVNSRPYVLESDDPGDLEGITPNDILISKNVTILNPGKFSETDGILKRQWRVSQYLVDLFWKKFISSYIPTLINRKKWVKSSPNINIGEVVVMNDGTSRGDWPIGLVTAVYPGKDGIVRTVDVKTAKGLYRRPVNKLCQTGIESAAK